VNGSFENHNDCPNGIIHKRLTVINSWFQPTEGSADYYHPCGRESSGVPENKFGFQKAHSGNAYIGMHLFVNKYYYESYKEYLMGKLKTPLIKDGRYVVSFRVSRADKARYAIDRIGAYLSSRPVQSNTYGMVYYLSTDTVNCREVFLKTYPTPQLESPKQEFITSHDKWIRISDTITAKGDEKFILLGSFFPNKNLHLKNVNPEGKYSSAYYYFDDVQVYMVGKPPPKPEKKNLTNSGKNVPSVKDSLQPGFTFEIENIYFAFDKSYLKSKSKQALQKLYGFMKRHPSVHIEIQGHTDSLGSHRYNQKLSERRAISVKRYLEMRGIAPERMKTKGFGKRNPLMTNQSEKGRAKNRRVMLKILENPQDQNGP
jgi:outer membrane protein OmpA-like peptidoglycan-associated protein